MLLRRRSLAAKPFARAHVVALAALPLWARGAFSDTEIVTPKGVSTLAMCFESVLRRSTHTPKDILRGGHRLHVVRVDTVPDAAEMVNDEPHWYRTFRVFVGPAMYGDRWSGNAVCESAVSVGTNVAAPEVAARIRVNVHLSVNALKGWGRFSGIWSSWHSGFIPRRIAGVS